VEPPDDEVVRTRAGVKLFSFQPTIRLPRPLVSPSVNWSWPSTTWTFTPENRIVGWPWKSTRVTPVRVCSSWATRASNAAISARSAGAVPLPTDRATRVFFGAVPESRLVSVSPLILGTTLRTPTLLAVIAVACTFDADVMLIPTAAFDTTTLVLPAATVATPAFDGGPAAQAVAAHHTPAASHPISAVVSSVRRDGTRTVNVTAVDMTEPPRAPEAHPAGAAYKKT
jgi:hypothetical protein